MKKKKSLALLIPLCLFFLTFILRTPSFYKPFDLAYESQLAFWGREAFVGRGFYATPWSMKPLGECLTYGLLYILFGSENWVLSIRIFLTILSALATLFIYLLGKKLFGNWAGLTAALFFSVFFSKSDVFNGLAAYAEMLMPFFTVFGFYLFFIAKEKKSQSVLFFSGLSLGISLIFKQSALYDFTPLFLWSFGKDFLSKKENFKSTLLSHLPLILGFLLPMAIFVSYISLIGRIIFLWDWMIRKPMLYAKLREKYPFPYILRILKKTYPVFILAFLGIIVSFFKRQSKRFLFVLWLLFTPLTFITSGKFWSYYFIQLFIPICFLAGIFIEDLWNLAKKEVTNFFLLGIVFLLGIILLLIPLNKKYYQTAFSRYFSFLRRDIGKADYIFSLSDGEHWKMRFKAVEFLKENMKPEDSLFVMEATPELYVLADKMPAYQGFVFEQQFFENKTIGFAFMHSFETHEGNRNKLTGNLRSMPPDFVALVIDSPSEFSVNKRLKEFPQFFSFVFKNYDLVKNIKDVWIYKLKKEEIEVPQGLVVDFEFVKKYFLVSDSGKKVVLEPLAGNPKALEATLTKESIVDFTFSPLEVQFLGPDGQDLVGYAFERPSGRIDFHLEIPKEPKPIKLIRIKKEDTLWIYPQNGFNALIKVIKGTKSLDLYFEPLPKPEGKYSISVIYQDSSISKTTINVKLKNKK